MKDKTLDTLDKLEELRKTRREFNDVYKSQSIARTCRHKDFGLQKWGSEETISQSSSWRKGYGQINWCNDLKTKIIKDRVVGSFYQVSTIKHSEEGRWIPIRQRRYKYHCTVKIQWNPIYNEKKDASRCGLI